MTEELKAEEIAEPAPANEEKIPAEPTDDGQEVKPEETPADDDAGAHSSKKGAQRRIGQLTRKYRQAERENLELKARLDAVEKRIGPVPEPERPNREGFETTEDYEDALFEWRDAKLSHAKQDSQPEPEAGQISAEQAAAIESFESALEEIAPDAILTVMEDDWPCSTAMTEYIMSSEDPANLAYHLATNTDIAEKISKVSPIQVARELAKVEGKLSETNPGAHEKPPPPPADTGRATGTGVTDPDKMSTNQWVAERRAGRI